MQDAMLLRDRLFRGMLAMLCVAAALNFGLSSLQGGVVELHHYIHGDQAAADGGWIIADGNDGEHHDVDHHDVDHHDVDADNGQTDSDGHHHHAAGDPGAAGLPTTAEPLSLPSVSASQLLTLARQLDGADPGVSGPVPRNALRTV